MVFGSAWRCRRRAPLIDMPLEIVRFALALHLRTDPHDIALGDRLEADLGLDPLDLVLVALRLEEVEEGEFPVALLETVTTVADLVGLVRTWSTRPEIIVEERETLSPPASVQPERTKSGTRRAVSAPAAATLPRARAARR
jgi:acyl carrier protein